MGKIENKKSDKAWVACVNMGYGHQRTAYPLKSFAYKGQIINANDYPGIPERDRRIWEDSRRFYEAISKFKRVPFIGAGAFAFYDNAFQKIVDFYPRRDSAGAPFLTKRTYGLIKKGWGKDLIGRMAKNPMPFVTTFFIPAFMAEEFNYPGEIYLIVCDADVSRQWVAKNPLNSRINYCAPTVRVFERLKLYGVSKRRLFLTGYPLPEKNIYSKSGDPENFDIAKADLGRRLANLDPDGTYSAKYCELVKDELCELPKKTKRPVTVMFSAGGAGAQSDIGIAVARQFSERIRDGKIKLILSAGINEKLNRRFSDCFRELGIFECGGAEVLFEKNIADYFERFNDALRKTDILWTKPSELSFYSALGLPIIVAPPIGSQEDFNKSWLLRSGFGIEQEDPRCVNQWLGDWLAQGYLAEAAMEGFIEGEKLGTNNIRNLVFGGRN
ncbi:MAG: hypothetical protein WCX69_06015 [Candidatus Paceibacterota bacterium]